MRTYRRTAAVPGRWHPLRRSIATPIFKQDVQVTAVRASHNGTTGSDSQLVGYAA
jgi:hypothetical protein